MKIHQSMGKKNTYNTYNCGKKGEGEIEEKREQTDVDSTSVKRAKSFHKQVLYIVSA